MRGRCLASASRISSRAKPARWWIHGAAQIRRDEVLGQKRPQRAETRRRYLWRGLLSIVSCREIGRDVGFAKSGFRPTEP